MTPSFIKILLRNNLVVAAILFILLGTLFAGLTYQDHLANVELFEKRHVANQRDALTEKATWFAQFVENERVQGKKRLEGQLRNMVGEAAKIITSIPSSGIPCSSRELILEIARETLRPIRFLNGRGYFFMLDLTGKYILSAVHPEMEGKNMLEAADSRGGFVVRDILRIATEDGEGFYEYQWTKPGASGHNHRKLSYVKFIPELDVIVGTEDYLEDNELDIQQHILTALENVGNDAGQYLFAGTFDGVSLFGPATGRNMLHVRDVDGVEVVKELIHAARDGGAFVAYTLPAEDGGHSPHRELGYAIALQDWGWYIGAGTSLEHLDRELLLAKENLEQRFLKYIATALLIVLIITACTYAITRRVVIEVKDNIDGLSDSFEKATRMGAPLSSTDASYEEFQRVKDSANRMILSQQKARHLEMVLLEINQHSQTSNTLAELLASIHTIMLRELGADNFFVALVNEEKDSLIYQYCEDSTISACPTIENINDPRQKRLSLYPIRQDRQVLLSKAEIQSMLDNGTVVMHGVIPETWLGVPLRVRGEIKGVMVIQDYDKPNSYSRMDQQLIAACSDQIALGIERKRAEEALAQSKNDFESIFNNSQVGIMLLRGGRQLYRGNQRLADILGYESPDDMKSISMRDLHLSDSRFLEFGEKYYYNLTREDQIQVEYQLARKDGTPVWCSLGGKALNPTNLDEGVVWVIDDIGPRKTMEEELKKVAEAANAANRAKSEFLANMSHEIRTPMNGVLGMLQLMQTTELNQEQKEYTDAAIRSSKRLTQLLTDILDLSRVEAGKLSIAEEPFNLPETLRQSIELFTPTARQAGLDLKLELGPELPEFVTGDPYRLQQILANLIGNALKFTQDGSVTVEAGPSPKGALNRTTVLFSISDTGIGIAQDQIEVLFSPFMQLDDGVGRKFQGAGLGLSICKRLIDLMGGHIDIQSEPGKGTAVFFSIGFKPAETPPSEQTAGTEPHDAVPALKVLLAEDDRVSAISAQRLMEKLGCTVVAVPDGIQALDTLKQQQFDAVFMDVQMPGMDGIETTQTIRSGEAGPDNRDIPIVALTAYAMAGDKAQFIEAGMTDYLSKPLDIGELEATLKKISRTT
jgi:PAS domain S-box-containing protein